MNRPMKVLLVSLLVGLAAISVGSVAATNGHQDGDLDQAHLREQLQDGSCTETEIEPLQERIQDRTQEQLQQQQREQLRDGDLAETEDGKEPVQERTQERSQIRDRFRFGCAE